MARVLDTKWFIDPNKQLITDYYNARIEGLNLLDEEVKVAIAELRLYHLPPYYAIPTRIKGKIQASSQLCFRLEEIDRAIRLENYLLATSPKKALMAAITGCSHCGKKIEFNWLETLPEWEDGLCEECKERYPLRYSYSQPHPWERVSYPRCQYCSGTETYALWGMCLNCYQQWQDIFIDPENLYKFVETYGALAALLIRPGVEWLNYMKQTLQHKYCYNAGKKSFPVDAEIEPFKMNGYRSVNLKDFI